MNNNPSILITDDNQENIKVLSGMLRQKDYRIRVAINGEQAVQSVSVESPDLILMDIQMPKMDGYEACRRIKGEEKNRSIPIIFLSAMTESFNKIEAFKVGGVDYISKPFQEEEVLARIKTHLTLFFSQRQLKEKNIKLLERFRSTFEQAAVGIAHVSKNGKFIEVNKKFMDMLGYEPDDIQAMTVNDISHPEDANMEAPEITKLWNKKLIYFNLEKRYIKKDGSFLWCNLTISLAESPGGDPQYYIAVLEDITKRKQAEEEIRISEVNFSNLFMKLPDAVFISHLDTHDKRIIIDLNPAAEKQTGYSREELIGKDIVDTLVLNREEKDIEFDEKRLLGGQSITYTEQKKRKDGSVYWTQLNLIEIEYWGKLCALSVNRDITELINAENELKKHRDHLEELVEERSLELKKKAGELESFNKIMVKREMRIIELKEEVNKLAAESGREGPYPEIWKKSQ